MTVLVAYASKHRSTQGIAERIADCERRCRRQVQQAKGDRAGRIPGAAEDKSVGSALREGERPAI